MPSQCIGRNKAGQPCSAQAWKDELCRWHHPELEEQRAEARRKGGAARSNRARARKQIPAVMSPDELAGWLSLLFAKVVAGITEPRIGTAAATIARTLLEVREVTDLERRLTALEERASTTQDRRIG